MAEAPRRRGPRKRSGSSSSSRGKGSRDGGVVGGWQYSDWKPAEAWHVAQEQADRLRKLTNEALHHQQFAMAAFYADKVISMAGPSINDNLLLCRAYYGGGHYARALHFMKKTAAVVPSNTLDNLPFQLCAAQCYAALGQWDACGKLLDTVFSADDREGEGNVTPKVVEMARSQSGVAGESVNVVSLLALFRGDAHYELDNPVHALQWYIAAIECDVYNMEAFDRLMDRQLLSTNDEQQLLKVIPQNDAESFIITYYQSRLNKYDLKVTVEERYADLDDDSGWNLSDNLDIKVNKADLALHRHDIATACKLTREVRSVDPFHERCSPVYFSALAASGDCAELFMAAHTAVQESPDSSVAWFGVGCYYFAAKRFSEARDSFKKSASLDLRFAPAWLGLGHSAAELNESEQALSAYRSASRLFRGSHLPLLSMAVESMRTQNMMAQAQQYLKQAKELCPVDPAIYNELAVLCLHTGENRAAVELFSFVLNLVADVPDHLRDAWEPAHFNLGHAHRKLGSYDKALEAYESCLTLRPDNPSTFSAIGFTYHLKGDVFKAIDYYHKALGLKFDDAFCQSMLRTAMEEFSVVGFDKLFLGGSVPEGSSEEKDDPPSTRRRLADGPRRVPDSGDWATPVRKDQFITPSGVPSADTPAEGRRGHLFGPPSATMSISDASWISPDAGTSPQPPTSPTDSRGSSDLDTSSMHVED